jgi:guanylate kinase
MGRKEQEKVMPVVQLPGLTLLDIPEINPAPPLLVVLSGPSGVGKDAALAGLKEMDRPWHFAVTTTTRPPRPGELEGVDYHFLDIETFLKMKERDQFLECAEVYGRWYGVPRSPVRQALKNGKDVILKVDVQGAATIRRLAPEALFIMLLPASYAELRRRLQERMSESASDLEVRLRTAQRELAEVGKFDYRVINRDGGLDQAIAHIDAIIAAEKCRVIPRLVQFL